MHEVIAFGEIWAGVAYILAGAGFLVLSQLLKTGSGKRSFVKISLGLLFITAGVEELFDAAVDEGNGAYATAIQAACTGAQVVFNSIACWILYQAAKWELIKGDG